MNTEALTVGEVAGLANVTIRTLHHYDEIGLVVPERTSSGYRIYGGPQIDRLQEVLFFRELGFTLDDITRIVGEPTYARESALLRQRKLLEAKTERLIAMLEAIDQAIESDTTGEIMNYEERLEVFGDFDPAEYEDEAKERWGDSDAYKQSVKRTSQYTKDDWLQNKVEVREIYAAFVTLMSNGVPPASAEAADVVERHRSHISHWYYDCSKEIHAGLGEMYVADPRFTKNIDKHGEGLAAYMSEAIAAASN
jgi:DNA-binding transcriptional MerR regulator